MRDESDLQIYSDLLRSEYRTLTETLIRKGLTITTMESCTSGLIASLITDTEGSSAIFKGAFVTYSNEAKILNGVPAEVIEKNGVYSEETAVAMAEVCRERLGSDIGVGVTGSFANADPNNADSVPGEVFFAISTAEGTKSYHCSVPIQSCRLSSKLFVADMVADRLFTVFL